MKIDPDVQRQKYEHELERLDAQASLLRDRGIHVIGRAAPNLDVLFLPSWPVRFDYMATDRLARRAELVSITHEAFAVRFGLDDYDLRAPSVTFVDPRTMEPLSAMRAPRGFAGDRLEQQLVVEKHPKFGRPFFCIPGTREYHEHPEHSGYSWLTIRRDVNVFRLIDEIWRACVRHARPYLGIATNAMAVLEIKGEK